MFPFWDRVKEPKKPFDCHVEYHGGMRGRIPVWADDMRDALRLIRELMPEGTVALKMEIQLRTDDPRLELPAT